MKKLLGLLIVGMLAFAGAAHAAQTPTQPPYSVLGGTANIAVTATTARAQLPASSAFAAVTLSNYGAKDCFIVLGGSSVVATTSGIPVRAGKAITIWIGSNTYVAAIAGGADTTSLDIYQATGPVSW